MGKDSVAADTSYDRARQRMVEKQLISRGISDPRVLEAFRRVPRHRFIPPVEAGAAYEDHPVPIGYGQTISQPYIVAYMLQELRLSGTENVLEIGTGSGYQTALLAELARTVYTIERLPEISQSAQKLLSGAGYQNIIFRVADGTVGWADKAPFERIIVTAGAPEVPVSLAGQLADKGIMIIPVGDEFSQVLLRLTRHGADITEETLTPCVFVKLIGKEGWHNE